MTHNDEHTAQVQRRVLDLFTRLHYTVIDALSEASGTLSPTGRQQESEPVLRSRLLAALYRLNPTLPDQQIQQAMDILLASHTLTGALAANETVYKLLKDGVKIKGYRSTTGRKSASVDDQESETPTVNVIDWHPTQHAQSRNEFVLVRNFWLSGPRGRSCIPFVAFVNGLPWLLIETQAMPGQDLYRRVTLTYQQQLPQLFWYNALILLVGQDELGNDDCRVGSMSASWEYYFPWKRVADEDETESNTIDTFILGLCEHSRLLDLVENFTLFRQEGSGSKLIARNHQFLGVNRAFASFEQRQQNGGRLGVFWHTQGSGKSYSMVFFVQKIFRTRSINWTFVIVTDRDDLDGQIYQTFARVGAVSEPESIVRAPDREGLQQLLREEHRTVFTLIQKFGTEKAGQVYPELSTRDDIVVISDEAHRSQYDTLADNMRKALPNASFIGFTGTPLIDEEEHATRATFGDYVSIYNFSQAIKDHTTVPLFYENHTPEVAFASPTFREAVQRLVGIDTLTEEQERELANKFARELDILTDDRLTEVVARDIVTHFMARGYMGKAMVVCIDKLATVRMYKKVRKYWAAELQRRLSILQELQQAQPLTEEMQALSDSISYMQQTEMAIILSNATENNTKKGPKTTPRTGDSQPSQEHEATHQESDRAAQLAAEGIDLKLFQHHKTLETNFKNADHPLRIVFVCAMWMTGFDIPSLSTVYLDRPMRGHTLMQTIARANRVFGDKVNGIVIDYVGTFNDLIRALAIYASDTDRRANDIPVGDKKDLLQTLREAMHDTETFCQQQGLDVPTMLSVLENGSKHEQQAMLDDAINKLVAYDQEKFQFLTLAGDVRKFYKAILPDPNASEFTGRTYLFRRLEAAIYDLNERPDITTILPAMKRAIASSLTVLEEYDIREAEDPYVITGKVDLSRIDVAALASELNSGHSHTKSEILRGVLSRTLRQMIGVNPTRIDYEQKFQRIVDDYNSGSANQAVYYARLADMTQDLSEEQQRHIRENLSEKELAIFDLLTRPEVPLNENERKGVKRVAHDLLARIQDIQARTVEWYNKPDARSTIRDEIGRILNNLPPNYDKAIYDQKCQDIYDYIYQHALA